MRVYVYSQLDKGISLKASVMRWPANPEVSPPSPLFLLHWMCLHLNLPLAVYLIPAHRRRKAAERTHLAIHPHPLMNSVGGQRIPLFIGSLQLSEPITFQCRSSSLVDIDAGLTSEYKGPLCCTIRRQKCVNGPAPLQAIQETNCNFI